MLLLMLLKMNLKCFGGRFCLKNVLDYNLLMLWYSLRHYFVLLSFFQRLHAIVLRDGRLLKRKLLGICYIHAVYVHSSNFSRNPFSSPLKTAAFAPRKFFIPKIPPSRGSYDLNSIRQLAASKNTHNK